MPKDLPYLASYKNLPKLFQAIAAAKVPDAFTHGFLYETLGLKGTGDRPLIPYLKKLGFLDPAGKPTSSYALLKNYGTQCHRRSHEGSIPAVIFGKRKGLRASDGPT